MNKLLPFALALALALPGCAAGDTAPQPPETPTTTKRVMIPPWGRRSTA